MQPRVLVITAALALGLAACSGGSGGTDDVTETPAEPTADGEVVFVATESIRWEQDEKSATLVDGALDVTIRCAGAVPHNVHLEGVADDAVIAECDGDDQGTGTVEVEPGTYTYYCSIPTHRATMEGEITVS